MLASLIIDASTTTDLYIGNLFRPWKMIRVRVYVHSGSPSGATLSIGDSRGGTSIVNAASLTNDDGQSVAFTQTSGSYTNQTGSMFLRIASGGGSSGKIQVRVSYYSGYPGASNTRRP